MTDRTAALPRNARVPLRWATVVVSVAAAAGVAAGVALHGFGASSVAGPALPALHGQAVWPPGERPAPGFALRDQRGTLVSLAALRGRPVLLTFLDSRCHQQCPIEGRQLASLLNRMPTAERPTLVVVSVDPAGDNWLGIRAATTAWGLAGAWRWHWLNAPRPELARVWKVYGITVAPQSGGTVHSLALYLIDRRGDERTAYLFPFLPGFVQSDLSRIARS